VFPTSATLTRRRHRGAAGFSLLEIVGVVLVLGLLAGAVGWSTRHTLTRSLAADARSTLAWLEGAARQAGRRGDRARLIFDLSAQRVSLWINGREPGPALRVDLPRAWRIGEVWTAEHEAFSGEVALEVSSRGHLPTYALQAGPARTDRTRSSRWWLVAGVSGQRFELPDRYAVREVFDALR